eukprot:15179496-Ditylum_brightwellii.AAC.1
MDSESKETAKELLWFAQVSVHVVLKAKGRIVIKGREKCVDFEGLLELLELLGLVPTLVMIEEMEEESVLEQKKVKVDQVFDMDDDFSI